MMEYALKLELLSDTAFGRGDGVDGLVDIEVQHDAYGLPFLGGRALKGLMGAECDDIVFALAKANGFPVHLDDMIPDAHPRRYRLCSGICESDVGIELEAVEPERSFNSRGKIRDLVILQLLPRDRHLPTTSR